MPFITEEIYHQLRPRQEGDDLTIKQLGEVGKNHATLVDVNEENILALGSYLKEVITAIRDARVKNNIKPKDVIKLYVQTDNIEAYRYIQTILLKQVNAESIQLVNDAVPNTITVVVGKDKLYMEAETVIDTAAQKQQLQKELDHLKGFLLSVDKKLSNERFVQNAKPEVVEIERKKKRDAEQKIKAIEESLSSGPL